MIGAITVRAILLAVFLAVAPAHHTRVDRERAYAERISHAGHRNERCLNLLWERESDWNPWAVNPVSGAYGIPQALGHGHPYPLGKYRPQIRWGLHYIWSRYGHSCRAWRHERTYGWY